MSDHGDVERWLMHLGDGDDGNMWNLAENVQDAYNDLRAENERLRAELRKVEPVLVAADRLREAYEAMIEGRDIGRLEDWSHG